MFHSKASLVALSLLPVILAQSNTTDSSNSTTNNSATSASSTATPSTVNQSFSAPTVTGSSCGTTQQNFNQCVTKVAKDISNCPNTDNTCLCQTYANIAACYNGCPDLVAQGESYQQQSTQYCAVAGIKPNTTATVTTSNTTAAVKPTSDSAPISNTSTSTTRSNSTSAPPSTASTFAAKSGATAVQISVTTALAGFGLIYTLFA